MKNYKKKVIINIPNKNDTKMQNFIILKFVNPLFFKCI